MASRSTVTQGIIKIKYLSLSSLKISNFCIHLIFLQCFHSSGEQGYFNSEVHRSIMAKQDEKAKEKAIKKKMKARGKKVRRFVIVL